MSFNAHAAEWIPPWMKASAPAAAPAPVAAPAPAPVATPAPEPTPVAPVAPVVEVAKEPVASPKPKTEAIDAALNAVPEAPSASPVTPKDDATLLDVNTPDEEETPDEPVIKRSFTEKEIMESEDPRENVNIVFVGHVDAGKSTTCGNILYITGQVDKRQIEKYEREAKSKNRESWFLAYIMDTNEEERNKGKTVEVGRAYLESATRRFTILDAPGHKNYVPNMIAGAAQADAAVLVISARKGEFEAGFDRSGQTREHIVLIKTLGVRKVIVVVNKMDDPSVKWAEKRYKEVQDRLNPFLKNNGFNIDRDITYLPISGLLGYNLKDLVPADVCSWYKGKALLDLFDSIPIMNRDPKGPLRLPILEKYMDRGVTITGKVESGRLVVGDEVRIMPNSRSAEILSITINEKEVISARCGENVNVKVRGISESNLYQGDIICHEDTKLPAVKEFEAQLILLDLLDARPIFCAGYTAVLHIHTAVEEVQITAVIGELDKATKKLKKVPFVRSNAVCKCRFLLTRPLCIETYDIMPQLGRFCLRDEGKTIGIGKITKIIN
ncbi:hypothetical protein WA158_000171 [Blastocystis sp. Blastoise]